MKIVKIILGTIVGLLTLVVVISIIYRITTTYDGSAFESGGLGGSMFVTCLAAVGSIMLFKSALGKPNLPEEKNKPANTDRNAPDSSDN